MKSQRTTCLPKRNRPISRRAADGVILLVMLGLLSIFTLVAVTFVVSSGHARRGARAASSAEQMGDPFDVLLNQAMMQVARGSNHPQSAIGPWGILEDMYGNSDVVTGAVYHSNDTLGQNIYDEAGADSRRANNNAFTDAFTDPATGVTERYSAPMFIEIGAVSFGWDREPGVALVDDGPSNSLIDDVDEWMQGDDCFLGMTKAHPATLGIPPTDWQSAWSSGSLPLIDNVDNYYAGRVITFVNGDCAGQSSHIVRSKVLNPGGDTSAFRTILFIQPFGNGSQPRKKDRFVINGRPFNGNGAGYSPYIAGTQTPKSSDPNQARLLRALDMPYNSSLLAMPGYANDALANEGEAVAILPNPTDSGYRDYLTRFNSIVAMDEDYDAPDEQNMHMSYTVWTSGGYKTIMPSFHRPDLVRYHTAEHLPPDSIQRWLSVPPYIRRRYILRPDPSDHYDYAQEPNSTGPGSGDGWTPGEPFEDINGNGQWDPIATNPITGAVGPEKYTDINSNMDFDVGDRSFFNSGIDMMDGPWDVDNDGDGVADSIWLDLGMPVTSTADGRFVKPLFAIMVKDLDGRINVNAHGSSKHYTHIHNSNYPAEGPYDPRIKPSDTRYNTEERVRMGIYNYALLQLVKGADNSTTIVNSATGQGTDALRTHSVGDIDPNFNIMSPQDVKFAFNKLFALAYNGDRPGTNTLVPNAAWMFDISGFRSLLDGNADYDRVVCGFEPAVGQGYSAADVNMAQVLHSYLSGLPGLPSPVLVAPGPFYRYNPLRRLIEGQGDTSGESPPTLGRYGEAHLLRPMGRIFPNPAPPWGLYGYYPGLGVTPKAGITDLFLPRPDYYGSAQPSALYYATTAMVPDMGGADTAVAATAFYGAAIAQYQGDDDNPRLPVMPDDMLYGTTNYGKQNGYQDSRYLFGSKFRNSFPTRLPNIDEMNNPDPTAANEARARHEYYLPVGDFGTPGDFDSDGFVALDIMGNPVYEKMGTEYEDVDAPTEINLNRRYFAQTFFSGGQTPAGRPTTTDIDSPYTPAELERLLRQRDSNSSSLPARLWSNLYHTASYNGVAGDVERSVTSEQWDVPCPHIAPTPEMSAALAALNLPVVNPSLGDLLRARFYLASGTTVSASQTALLATIAMRSYRLSDSDAPVNEQLPAEARKRWQTRLLSPDLGLGVKMDLNAPFGNSFDDDGDGTVDNPRETLGDTDRLAARAGSVWFNFDGNRDGNFVAGIDEEARQQYAKELYCLMMLLIDQNYAEPRQTAINAAGTGPGAEATSFPQMTHAQAGQVFPTLSGDQKTRRWLYARKIAQWAVNTVDFRDRDAIMTPFEFDVDPFHDNDGDAGTINISRPVTNGTWDVDGYIIRNEAISPTLNLANDPDINKPWRGLVWGCEFPDLILTESVAFHDRRTQNLRSGTSSPTSTAENGLVFASTNYFSTSNPTGTEDPDWDQYRIPQGTALFELFCTGNRHNPALPTELYTLVTYTDPVNLKQMTEYKLDLGRLAGNPRGPGPSAASTPNPVWRLAITESHTRPPISSPLNINDMKLSIAERIQEFPMTCSLELSDPGMSLLNPQVFSNVSTSMVPIERVVHFSTVTNVNLNNGAKVGLVTSAGTGTGIEVYSNQYKGASFPSTAWLSPGEYAVIGPWRTGSLRNITTIGRTETNMLTITTTPTVSLTTVTDYSQPQSLIDMGDFGTGRPFVVTSVNGVDEYPRTGQAISRNYLNGLIKMPLASETGMVDNSNPPNPAVVQQIRPPLTIPCAATLGARVIGLNVSEPNTTAGTLNYYPALTAVTGTVTVDAWNLAFTTTDRYTTVRDVPLDDDLDGVRGPPVRPNNSLPHSTTTGQVVDQTLLNFKTVFLQRLANPLISWHQYFNPYITIDWMPIDLTIFNGEPFYFERPGGVLPSSPSTGITQIEQYYEPISAPPADNQFRFGSRQRGAPRYPVRGLYSLFDLWSQPNWIDTSPEFDTRPPLTGKVSESNALITTYLPATNLYRDYYKVGPVKWQHPLDHTLGYLNMGYHSMRDWPKDKDNPDPKGLRISPVREPIRRPNQSTVSPSPTDSRQRGGWYTYAEVGANNFKYIGAPRRPFNWLTWNNRPFAGSMELMLVPCTSQARLMHEYSMRRTITPSAPDSVTPTLYSSRLAPFDPRRNANHYMPSLPAAGHTNWYSGSAPENLGRLAYGYTVTAPFAHLLNFFESTNGVVPVPSSSDLANPEGAPNLFRLFEFVTVPSRFSGTKRMHLHMSRNNAAEPSGSTPSYGTTNEHFGWPFTAPFNYIPAYREPGRVNINTIIPLANHSFPNIPSSNYNYSRRHRGERIGDDGASIWRSVLNDFHPAIKWLAAVDTGGSTDNGRAMRGNMNYSLRAGGMTNAVTLTSHKYFFNPSEDTVDNFYSLFASLISDNPQFDPRGTDSIYGTSGDAFHRPFMPPPGSPQTASRQDPTRTSLFSNPFRSFMSDYSAVVPEAGKHQSAATTNPLLAADSTLMRRRDTTWSPWSPTWKATQSDAMDSSTGFDAASATGPTSKLFYPSQLDPRFDPMFTLNYPRPFRTPNHSPANPLIPQVAVGPSWWQYSGYSSPLFDARPNTTLSYTGATTTSVDAMRVRDTDFRNTDRNPFFRYQMYTKLSNTVTTRSNVYAIWITIGFFECERVQPGVQFPVQTGQDINTEFATKHRYPDGFRLLRELGSDTGETQRHRAFAILDRTIPVGFMRGENLNVDRAFIIKHIID